MQKKAAIVLFFALLVSSPAFAQDNATRTPVEHKQMVTANPIGIVFGWFNAEYERKATETTTWGISASNFQGFDDDFNYSNVSALARYYPQGAALTGFFVGGKIGFHHVSDDNGFGDDDSTSAIGLGVDVGYNWLIGKERKFAISIGMGATRLFGEDTGDIGLTIPNIRVINIGFAF
jgi:hypothetical protein